jgi:hypothetical protein
VEEGTFGDFLVCGEGFRWDLGRGETVLEGRRGGFLWWALMVVGFAGD